MSRRGALALVSGGAAMIGLLTAGQTLGGFTRPFALLLPRGRDSGTGPNGFPINRTAAAAGISPEATTTQWQLTLTGGANVQGLTRDELLAMPQHTAVLPIACVEGWSSTQTWTGVRLRDLAALSGVENPTSAQVTSLERSGSFKEALLQRGQVLAPDSLLALKVNSADLSLDHGFPARIIVPAMPGVHNTKWVSSIRFEAD
jgi:DMSO/TMAO reductase YedYZ molybdopterin-dependent catalytic subunit